MEAISCTAVRSTRRSSCWRAMLSCVGLRADESVLSRYDCWWSFTALMAAVRRVLWSPLSSTSQRVSISFTSTSMLLL